MNWLLLSAHVHEDLKLLTLATAALLLGAATLVYLAPAVAEHAHRGKRPYGGPLLERSDQEPHMVVMPNETAASKLSKPNSDS